jgi:hypothetical protein
MSLDAAELVEVGFVGEEVDERPVREPKNLFLRLPGLVEGPVYQDVLRAPLAESGDDRVPELLAPGATTLPCTGPSKSL